MTEREPQPRRRASDNDLLPSWAKPVVALGVPTVLVFWLLGAVPGVPSPMVELRAAVAAHDRGTTYLLRRICINTATTREDRIECANGGNP